jgi:hypothetical protein
LRPRNKKTQGKERQVMAAKKKPLPKGNKKVGKVMGEYKRGTLNIGKSEKKVKSKEQAVAIALSEQRKVEKKK